MAKTYTDVDFLVALKSVTDLMVKKGFTYSSTSAPTDYKKFEKEKKSSCSNMVSMALQKMQLLKANQVIWADADGDICYRGFDGQTNSKCKAQFTKYFDIIKVNKTWKAWKKEALPGDICFWHGHTNVYAGSNKTGDVFYDSGRHTTYKKQDGSKFKNCHTTFKYDKVTIKYVARFNMDHRALDLVIPDISHWEPVRDWAAVKRCCPFIITKATQGTTYVDPTLKSFIKNCEANEIPYYLYTFLNKGNELAQTKFMVKTCKGLVGKYFRGYVLDVEANNPASGVKEALKYLEGLKAGKVGLYTMYAQYSKYKTVIAGRAKNTFWWEARYGKNDGTRSTKYKPHAGCDMHQYTSVGTCPGIKDKGVDLNVILSDTKTMAWYRSK